MEIKGKKVTVIGLGNSGFNAASLLHDNGARVWVTDSSNTPVTRKNASILKDKGIRAEVGIHTEDFIIGSSFVVISPGVEDSSIAVKWAMKYSIPIISEMELGYRFCKGKIIAITGTNGKSTVTMLIGEILKRGGKETVVCGNIGNSLCGEIKNIGPDTWVVLEVSSFQLEKIEKFRPRIALILNITDDHMDRYAKFADYFNEKLKIFSNQQKDDFLILNYDAENLRTLKSRAHSKVLFYSRNNKAKDAYLDGEVIFYVKAGVKTEICQLEDIPLKGLHNIENFTASALACLTAGVDVLHVREAIKKFKGLAHRFETVGIIDGVEYIDDSKGTTVDSTRRALESCEKPVILIAGGKDKYSNYRLIGDMLSRKVKHMILIGEAAFSIKKALGHLVNTRDAKDMQEAVLFASGLAEKDSIVLLSPMCSSFDMFSSYKERGEVFKKAVEGLKAKKSNIKVAI